MDGYLSKPIDVDELIATVERFGGGRPLEARGDRPPSRQRRPSSSTSARRSHTREAIAAS